MAKYSRYDVRNKKQSRHKRQSLERDLRIKHVSREDTKKRGSFYSRDMVPVDEESWYADEDHYD